jgi:SAM-dependent methyltransferase
LAVDIPFTQVPGHLDAMELLVEITRVSGTDAVVDVACGPGLVACAFARHAFHVTGIDITPAMIDQARRRQEELALRNLAWVVGEADPLPFPDGAFSLVITRYSFHHFLEPRAALKEMIRVCRPGGRVLVADVAVPETKAAAYDRLEKVRDPSHVHALTEKEFEDLFGASGLVDCRRTGYGVDIELEAQLAASFPRPGDEAKLREMFMSDLGVNDLGIDIRRQGDAVVYTVPIAVYVGEKAP